MCLLVVNTLVSSHLFGSGWRDQFGLSQLGLSMAQENVNTAYSKQGFTEQYDLSFRQVLKILMEGVGCCTKLKALLI